MGQILDLLYQVDTYIPIGEFIAQLQKLDPALTIGTDDSHYPLSVIGNGKNAFISHRPKMEIDWQTMEWEDYKKKYPDFCTKD